MNKTSEGLAKEILSVCDAAITNEQFYSIVNKIEDFALKNHKNGMTEAAKIVVEWRESIGSTAFKSSDKAIVFARDNKTTLP